MTWSPSGRHRGHEPFPRCVEPFPALLEEPFGSPLVGPPRRAASCPSSGTLRAPSSGQSCSALSSWSARSPGMSGFRVNRATATMYSSSPAQPRPSSQSRRMWSRTFGSLL